MLLSDEKVTFQKLDVLISTEASIFPLLEKDTRVFDNLIREVCGKSKWKFLMAFAIRGGGLEGVSFAIKLF